ncbi:MAG: hypothetical protein R6U02_06050 [Alkalibacterium sp.]|uniref:hypothetical protein n=1 Tax=Alkalibacterium sp. TaxID=1872447 RepID=UPI003970E224
MELWIVASVLFGSAVLVFGYSFTQKQEKEQAYKELEYFSLEVTKTVYDLNERVKTLESELQVADQKLDFPMQVTQLNKDNIVTLFTKGVSTEIISRQLRIASASVQEIIDSYIEEGIRS